MTSREIVTRTLDFERPARVARSFSDSDFRYVTAAVKTYASDWREGSSGRWESVDEWGNRWVRADPTSKGQVVQGALADFSALDPDFWPF